MIKKGPLARLVIRSGAVRTDDIGYVLAEDPKKDPYDSPHTILFTINAGVFKRGGSNFNAHSCCVIQSPEPGFLQAGAGGGYAVVTRKGFTAGNIFKRSSPKPKEERYGDISSVAEIGGRAYAVGLGGMAYALESVTAWRRIDDGLGRGFDGEAIHGFSVSEIYAVGFGGQVWQFDGADWSKRDIPTKVNLSAVKCGGDGKVYVAGHEGVLVHGRGNVWTVIDHGATKDDVWDLEWFEGALYVSTLTRVYRLEGKKLREVDFGEDRPKTCYHLSAAERVMWSIGEGDVMSYDGKRWKRIV